MLQSHSLLSGEVLVQSEVTHTDQAEFRNWEATEVDCLLIVKEFPGTRPVGLPAQTPKGPDLKTE